MAPAHTLFHGNDEERFALLAAIAHNCACEFGTDGSMQSSCDPHRALIGDQRFLDGLLFERWRQQAILLEEYNPGTWEKLAPYRWRGELQQ